jgi:hypothetical protein
MDEGVASSVSRCSTELVEKRRDEGREDEDVGGGAEMGGFKIGNGHWRQKAMTDLLDVGSPAAGNGQLGRREGMMMTFPFPPFSLFHASCVVL